MQTLSKDNAMVAILRNELNIMTKALDILSENIEELEILKIIAKYQKISGLKIAKIMKKHNTYIRRRLKKMIDNGLLVYEKSYRIKDEILQVAFSRILNKIADE